MISGTEFLIYGVITLTFVYLLGQRKPKNFPPGPWGLPLLGHLPLLGLEPQKALLKWKAKYGPIVGIDFGSFRAIVITDFKLIKEALNENSFAGRAKLQFTMDRSGGHAEGIIHSEGKDWQDQRRFTLRKLRDFGFGTRSIEGIVQEEIQELIERFKEEVGTPISTTNKFNVAVVNALWTICTGERFKQDDPELNKIIKLVMESFDIDGLRKVLGLMVPWISKYMPDFISQYSEFMGPIHASSVFLQPYIDHQFKTHQDDNPRGFLDSYIDEMKRTTDPESSFYIEKKMPILWVTHDLFSAGFGTTSTTLSWIFLYMARHQHAQEKLSDEIQRMVGNSRLPSLNDRPDLPYVEAVIHEVMRVRTLIPMAMNSTTEDVVFHGFNIPKDTMVLTNLHEVHSSIELWGDPENFRPERFLSKDETKFVRQEGFVPFSYGKRACLGEKLARDELFLFTSALFQVFHVGIDPSAPASLEGTLMGVVMPKPHTLILSLR